MKSDHPAVPITLDEIIITAAACHKAGADGLHLHLRDARGAHILDAGLYREALQELTAAIPTMAVQITTEAVGIYAPDHQMQVALKSDAELASVSIREMTQGQDPAEAVKFYQAAADQGLNIQHILYDLSDYKTLKSTLPRHLFRDDNLQLLFVLGRYGARHSSSPDMINPFLQQMQKDKLNPDWAACAFGQAETSCLLRTWQSGGKIRIGFENSFWDQDGKRAVDNADRVRSICCNL